MAESVLYLDVFMTNKPPFRFANNWIAFHLHVQYLYNPLFKVNVCKLVWALRLKESFEHKEMLQVRTPVQGRQIASCDLTNNKNS